MPEWLVGQLTTTANLETLGQGGGRAKRSQQGREKDGKSGFTQQTCGKMGETWAFDQQTSGICG